MKCGCGAFGSCDLGGYRICKDGPIFDAKELEGTEFGRAKREKSGKRIAINASCPHSDFVAVENHPKLLRSIIKEIRAIVHPKPIAVGGIFSARDVIDYAKNGASMFQVGSALVSEDLEIFSVLKKELKAYLGAKG